MNKNAFVGEALLTQTRYRACSTPKPLSGLTEARDGVLEAVALASRILEAS